MAAVVQVQVHAAIIFPYRFLEPMIETVVSSTNTFVLISRLPQIINWILTLMTSVSHSFYFNVFCHLWSQLDDSTHYICFANSFVKHSSMAIWIIPMAG